MMYMSNKKEEKEKFMMYFRLLFYFPCYSVHTTIAYKNETEPEDKIYFIPELPKNGTGYLSELMNELEDIGLIYCVTDPCHHDKSLCKDFNYIGFTTDESLHQEAIFQCIDIQCNCMKTKSHEKHEYFLKEKSLFDVLQEIESRHIKFFQRQCLIPELPSAYSIDVTKLGTHAFLIADIDKYSYLQEIINDGWITCEKLAGNMYICNINSGILMVDKYLGRDYFTLNMLNESAEVYYWKASLPLLLGQIVSTKMIERKKEEKKELEKEENPKEENDDETEVETHMHDLDNLVVSSLSMSGTDMSFVKKPVYPRYYDMAFFIKQPGVGLTKDGIDALLELIKYSENVNLIEFTNKRIYRCAIGFVTTEVYKRFQNDELFYVKLKRIIADILINYNGALTYEFNGLNIFISY